MSYCQAIIRNAIIRNAIINSPVTAPSIDPCTGTTSPPSAIGQICASGATYAGTGYAWNPTVRYMTTPAGCNDESCSSPNGDDGTKPEISWADDSGANPANDVSTGATDTNNGKSNTAILMGYSDTKAAQWCGNMTFGGYHDWFLPAENELLTVLFANSTSHGGLLPGLTDNDDYWSSTEIDYESAWFAFLDYHEEIPYPKGDTDYVRCIRTY